MAGANWQFHSRPEFAVPRLNITILADDKSVETGLIFIAPLRYPGAILPTQPGAYIFRDDGELVWSGLGYYCGQVVNFGPDVWDGRPYLRAFQGEYAPLEGRGYGYHTLLGPDYEIAKVIKTTSPKKPSVHEINLIGGKTALIETPLPRPIDLKPWGGDDGQDWVLSSGFQEVDINTNKVLFDWESLHHVDPKYSAFPLYSGEGGPGTGLTESAAWDYFHLNSVDKDENGDYLISARHMAAIYKINGTSGDTIWKLGGLHNSSDFDVAIDDRFSFQHYARFLGRSADGQVEMISLFDNAAHNFAPDLTSVPTRPHSRAQIFELNHGTGRAKAIKTFDAPDGISARAMGSAQTLPNGNVFVNWGQAGAITEFSEDGTVLFHSYLDSAGSGTLPLSYNAFRANWTGTPAEAPAIMAHRTGGKLSAYVSWNGDTETAWWRFYARHLEESRCCDKLLADVKRDGFETQLVIQGEFNESRFQVFAEATDANKKVLTRSGAVDILQHDLPPTASIMLDNQQIKLEL